MNYTNKQKLELIRIESGRIWEYLKEAIDCLENKYYTLDFYDMKELLAYCKSCEDSYEEVEKLTYEMEEEDE